MVSNLKKSFLNKENRIVSGQIKKTVKLVNAKGKKKLNKEWWTIARTINDLKRRGDL